jgi:hypothetical protein
MEQALLALIATEGFLCDVAPLTCPRHLARSQRCEPRPVPAIKPVGEVIARQVAGPDRTLNVGLLWTVLEFLDMNPHRWTQDQYLGDRGGVIRGCLAGWALVFNAQDPPAPRLVIAGMPGSEIYRTAMHALGLADWQAGALFGFMFVADPDGLRHPTFAELCERVNEICGVRYTPRRKVEAA